MVRDERMSSYLKVAKQLQSQFKEVKVKRISHGQNILTNSLATLASLVQGSIPWIILVESI